MNTSIFKIFKTTLLFIAATIFITSCGSDELIKDEIDAEHSGDSSKLPAITLNAAEDITYEGAKLAATLSNAGDEIIESGFIYSTDESFTTMEVNTVSETGTTITTTLSLISEKTYYVKAYAQTKNNGIAYSNTINFTTLKAPTFEDTYLFGTYDALDTDYETGEAAGDVYGVKIAQKESYYNKITIYNIWDGAMTIDATVDFETKTISVDYSSVIYIHSSYGNVYMYGLSLNNDGSIAGYKKTTIATYDTNGNIEFEPWAAHCSAGDFGFQTTSLKKK